MASAFFIKMHHYLILCSVLHIVHIIQSLDVIPGKPEVTYKNEKYFKRFVITTRREGRRKPYSINLDLEPLCPFGNNITAELTLYENLSGRYVPSMYRPKYKLCDWMSNEPVLGKMWTRQLPKEFQKCPVPPGRIIVKNALIHLENFEYLFPFTWSEYRVMTRMEVHVYQTDTKEGVVDFSMIFTVTQMLKTRNKTSTITNTVKSAGGNQRNE